MFIHIPKEELGKQQTKMKTTSFTSCLFGVHVEIRCLSHPQLFVTRSSQGGRLGNIGELEASAMAKTGTCPYEPPDWPQILISLDSLLFYKAPITIDVELLKLSQRSFQLGQDLLSSVTFFGFQIHAHQQGPNFTPFLRAKPEQTGQKGRQQTSTNPPCQFRIISSPRVRGTSS